MPPRAGRLIALLSAGLALLAAGCSVEFSAERDYRRIAECYGTFIAWGIDATDPELALDLDRQETAGRLALTSLSRMQPYTAPAARAAGGEQAFLELASQAEADISIAEVQGAEAKLAGFQAIEAAAERCNETLTGWGAPPLDQVTPPSVP